MFSLALRRFHASFIISLCRARDSGDFWLWELVFPLMEEEIFCFVSDPNSGRFSLEMLSEIFLLCSGDFGFPALFFPPIEEVSRNSSSDPICPERPFQATQSCLFPQSRQLQ